MALEKSNRDLWACIKFGQLSVDLSAGGHGYSPDLVNDLLVQLQKSFSESLRTAVELGIWPKFDVDDDDDDEDEESDVDTEDHE